jgi:hypothetical protein
MSVAKLRVGGAWVDTDLAGSARLAGAWVPFGPAGGPTYERLTWVNAPTLLNGNDGNQDYNLGIRFSVTEDAPCAGVTWARTPTAITSTPSGGSHVAALWTADTETRLTFKNVVPTGGAVDQDYFFDDPVMLTAGALYVVSLFTRDYTYAARGGVDLSSPSGLVLADDGKLSANIDPLTFPSSTQAAHYFVGPIIEVPA